MCLQCQARAIRSFDQCHVTASTCQYQFCCRLEEQQEEEGDGELAIFCLSLQRGINVICVKMLTTAAFLSFAPFHMLGVVAIHREFTHSAK